MVLQGDQSRLERAQHRHRTDDDHGRPEEQMYPDRRREIDLDERRKADNDGAEKQDHEDSGTITGILG